MKKAAAALLLALSAPALAGGDLSIRLFSQYEPKSVEAEPVPGEKALAGRSRILVKGALVQIEGAHRAGPAKELSLQVHSGVWLSGAGLPRRLYKGRLSISADRGALKIIDTLDTEEYLGGVVAGEAQDLRQPEMRKAQAVAARTYTVAHRTNHARDGYNLCDNPHCQLFPGLADAAGSAVAAVADTAGEMLYYKRAPAMTYYHSVCGGRTETMTHVWPFEHKPYLVSVQDGPPGKPYCAAAPGFRWKTKIYFTGLTRLARGAGWLEPDEEARGLRVSARGESGRASELELYTRTRRVSIPATEFYHGIGRRAGWNAVRSSYFTITAGRDYVLLEGKGSGHGVGMCQWGAEGMAKLGFGYREILKHYYPGTEIRK